MGQFLSTPFLQFVAKKLAKLESKVAGALVRVDDFIQSKPLLQDLLGTDEESKQLKRITPFLNEKFIRSAVEETIAWEKKRAHLPRPGMDLREWALLNGHEAKVAEEDRKANEEVLSVKVEAYDPIAFNEKLGPVLALGKKDR